MDEKKTNVIVLPMVEVTPVDVAISRHIQNMMATYGEKKVRESLDTLFGLKSEQRTKAS